MRCEVMYHLAPIAARDRILEQGLRTGLTGGFSDQAATWAPDTYGANPVYLSVTPGASADTRYSFDGRDVWQVDITGLELVADLPGLYDNGAELEPGVGMYYHEGWTPDQLTQFENPDDGILPFEQLIHPGSCAQAAVAVTGTAACLTDIPASRLTLMTAAQPAAV